MRRSLLLLVLCCIATMLAAAPLWEHPLPVRTGYDIVWDQCTTATSDNGQLYVWSDSHDGERKLYAQKVDSQGNPAWAASVLLDNTAGYKVYAKVTQTTDNSCIIVYRNYQSLSGDILKAQKISNSGQLLWPAGGITITNVVQSYNKYYIVSDNAGGAYVAWASNPYSNTDTYGQHVNTAGQIQWTGTGIVLVGEPASYGSLILVPDGSGGLLLSYSYSNYPQNFGAVIVKKILPIGLTDWSHSIQTENNLSGYGISDVLQNSFLLTWAGVESGLHYLKAQRFSLAGNSLWETPAVVMSDSLLPTQTSVTYFGIISLANASDTAFIISWQDNRNNFEYAGIYAQKLDLDGNRLWTSSGVSIDESEAHKSHQRIISDNNGGCFSSWSRQGQDYLSTVYVQHINNDGTPVWQTNGIPISIPTSEQAQPVVNYLNGILRASWDDERLGSTAIWFQYLDAAGTALLEPNGRQLVWGIGGGVEPWGARLFPRVNDIAAVWIDYRQSTSRICYQFIHPDGTLGLEPDGRAVTESIAGGQYEFDAVTTPAGQILIAWRDDERIKLQLVDVNGDRLWGTNGIYLTMFEPLMQRQPKLSYLNGAFYVGWEELRTFGGIELYRIMGQKLVGIQKQWGLDGIIISNSDGTDEFFDTQMGQITGRYFIWIRYSIDAPTFGYQQVYVKLLNPDGTVADGWPVQGIATSTYVANDGGYLHTPRAVITPAGLFVCWLDFRYDYIKDIFGQLISPAGIRLWDPLGVELNPSEYETESFQLVSGNEIILAWSQREQNRENNYLQKFSLSGLPAWSESPVLFSGSAANLYNSEPSMARFDNGGLVAAWTLRNDNGSTNYSYGDIYYRYISAAGAPLGPTYGYPLVDRVNDQDFPKICVLNNEAYIIWTDRDQFYTNSGGEEGDKLFFSLYMQKVSNEVVAADDEVTPASRLTLQQNYPNPFSANTSIGFTLPAKDKVEISVYNLKGQKVRTLLAAKQDKGPASIVWDGLDNSGKTCSSGVYYYRLSAGDKTLTRKMVLLR